jgi:hypothetical protein
LAILIGSPLLGAWILASLWMKAKSDEVFLKRLRMPLNLGYILFFCGLTGAFVSLFGGHIPGYASWGLIHPGEGYGIMTLVSTMSYGVYAAVAMGLVAGVKSGDL